MKHTYAVWESYSFKWGVIAPDLILMRSNKILSRITRKLYLIEYYSKSTQSVFSYQHYVCHK